MNLATEMDAATKRGDDLGPASVEVARINAGLLPPDLVFQDQGEGNPFSD